MSWQIIIEEQIAEHKAQIKSLDASILEAVATGVASYSIDSGQTDNKVTLTSLDEMRRMKAYLMTKLKDLYEQLENAQTPSGAISVGAAF